MTSEREIAVCLLTETYYPVTGGGETQARVLASGLAAMGHAVHVLTRRSDAEQARSEVLDGARIWRLPPTGANHLKKWGLVFSAFLKLWRLRHDYDVVLVAGYRVLGIPSVIAARLLRKPCILKADSIGEYSGEFFDPGLRKLHLRHDRFPVNLILTLRNRLLRRADRFVSISNVISDELVDNGIPRSRIVNIPNSVDTDRFRPVGPIQKNELRKSIGIARGARVGIYTGRLVTTKGLPMLLRSWQQVAAACPDAMLLLVGEGGLGIQNCDEQLKRFVAEKQLEHSVKFTGSVHDVHRYLQAADFFVFPTEREAFGISILEALACEIPVVTTAVGGVSDIVGGRQIAIVFAPGDETALTSALQSVIQGGEEFERIARAGRQVAVERYSEQSVLRLYLELISDLCGSGSNE